MKHLNALHLAVLVVLAANALALWHASVNRQGPVESEIELTDRELVYHTGGNGSPVFLRLEYRGAGPRGHAHSIGDAGNWITEAELKDVGFGCSVPVKDPRAYEHYRRQLVRPVIAAFEYRPDLDEAPATNLIAVGIGPDVTSMRKRFPDRARVILLPASARIYKGADRPQAWLSSVPVIISVPHEFQASLRQFRGKVRPDNSDKPLYKVRLRYGANLEPWITSVEFPR